MRSNWAAVVSLVFLGSFVSNACAEITLAVDDRARLGEVYSLERLKEYAQAMPAIEDLHQRYGHNREVEWTYARVLGFGGHWKAATAAFNELCAAAHCDEDMFVTYGHILEAQGPDPETLPYIKKLAVEHPAQKEIQSVYAEILSWNVQDPKGHQAVEALSAQYPEDVKLTEALGDMAYHDKSYATAQEYYEKILPKDGSAQLIKKYADTLVAEKKYTDAIAQMDKLLAGDPSNMGLRYLHAQVLSAAGKHRQAVDDLEALLKNGFKNKEAGIMLGDELRLLGRDKEALKVYGEVINEK